VWGSLLRQHGSIRYETSTYAYCNGKKDIRISLILQAAVALLVSKCICDHTFFDHSVSNYWLLLG
jgi:hypothetical protein